MPSSNTGAEALDAPRRPGLQQDGRAKPSEGWGTRQAIAMFLFIMMIDDDCLYNI